MRVKALCEEKNGPQTPPGLGDSVDMVLLVFGAAALLGIWITGRVVDRHLRRAVLASLGVFALVALLFGIFAAVPLMIFVGVGVWGATFGGAATLLQTALADTAGEGADVALSMNVVTWNSAIAGAGVLGGLGVGSLPWVALVLVVIGFVIAAGARARDFPGRRAVRR